MSRVGKACVYEVDAGFNFKWKADYRFKKVGPNDILVKVISAGLNPIDYKIPDLGFMWIASKGKPVGMDMCGEIIEVGAKVSDFKVGDVVFGQGKGCCAEYAITAPSVIAKLPEGSKDAPMFGGLGVASGTAFQMLELAGAFDGGEAKNIMVIGASGGVGSSAIQIAKAKCPSGSKILGICSGKSAEYVKSIGADEIIDYSQPNFVFGTCVPEKSQDVIIDCVSSPDDYNYKPEGMKLLKSNTGQYVAANSVSKLDWIKLMVGTAIGFKLFRGQYQLMFYQPKSEQLNEIGKLVNDKKLNINVQEYVGFDGESIKKAFETLKGRRVRGKLVVKM